MINTLLVGIGGFVGSIARYWLGGLMQRATPAAWFPLGTFGVNVVGCLLLGFLYGLGASRDLFGTRSRMLLFVGVLGGFTTFSTFGTETYALMRDHHPALGLLNVALQVTFGLLAVWLGYAAGSRI